MERELEWGKGGSWYGSPRVKVGYMFVWVVVVVSGLIPDYFEGIADRFGCGMRMSQKMS